MFAIQPFVLLLSFLIFTEAMKSPSCPKAKNGSRCYLDYRTMDLWCDETDFTVIPNPADIVAYAPPERSLSLFFNSSCLTTITKDALEEYTCLIVFDASNNLLTKTEPSAFESCPKLEIIILSNNYITHIHQDSFKGLPNLEVIELNHNKLSEIHHSVFQNLPALETLILDRNLIKHLTAKLFAGVPKLRTLSLKHNHLREWPRTKNEVLKQLKVLELGHNRISRIAYYSFEGMESLKKLTLHDNKLLTIDARSFKHSPLLEHIDLRHNRLHSLDSKLFSTLRNLRNLHLGGNRLVTPHKEWFFNVMLNYKVDTNQSIAFGMQENPWKCDCNALDYLEFLQTTHSNKSHVQEMIAELEVKCISPINFTNKYLTEITDLEIAIANKCNATHQVDSAQTVSYSFLPQDNQLKARTLMHVEVQKKTGSQKYPPVVWFSIPVVILLLLIAGAFISWLAKNYKTRTSNWTSMNTVITKV